MGDRLLTARELNACTGTIIDAAIEVHKTVGPGLFEKAYLACLTHELHRRGLTIERQVKLSLKYKDLVVPGAYYPDLIVSKSVIVEVKALDGLVPIHHRQVTTYLRLADLRVGLLLNFGERTMKAGTPRIVNRFPDA
jgi:iron complex transport system substrate-binding protein